MASLPVLSLALVLVFGTMCVRDSLAADSPGISSPVPAPAPAPEYEYESVSLTPSIVPALSPGSLFSVSPAILAESGYDAPSPTPESLAPSPTSDASSPAPSPGDLASPSPSPGDLASKSPSPGDLASTSPSPSPSPVIANAPSPGEFSGSPPAPAPGPQIESEVTHERDDSANDSHDSGMSGGKKAGIAFGVISSACVVGLAAKVYKKRQENIRRAQFGYYGDGDYIL